MITRVELVAKLPDETRFATHWSYMLYAALCRSLPCDIVDLWHDGSMAPIRQCALPGPQAGQFRWVIDLFGEEAPYVVEILRCMRSIDLEQLHASMPLLECRVHEPITVESLLKGADAQASGRLSRIWLLTPMGFKSEDKYVQFPSAELIVKSLLNRFDKLMPECAVKDDDVEGMLIRGVRIKQYQLQSANYYLKGVAIPGFTGSCIMQATLPVPILVLWRLLISFAPYSGIGIKTTLGMGGVHTALMPG